MRNLSGWRIMRPKYATCPLSQANCASQNDPRRTSIKAIQSVRIDVQAGQPKELAGKVRKRWSVRTGAVGNTKG
jgi:hypothetical protein